MACLQRNFLTGAVIQSLHFNSDHRERMQKKRKLKALRATLQPFQKKTTITQMGGVVELAGSASMCPLN
jgi:hypothetical protein